MRLSIARSVIATVLLGSVAAAAGASPIALRNVRTMIRPSAGNLNQIVAEGGQSASLLIGNLMDVFGSPIVVSQSPLVYRDGPAPTLPETGIPGTPLSKYQFDYAAVGAGGTQLDFVAQQSGFAAASAPAYPATNDGEETYANSSPFGFLPWAGVKSEPLSPTTAPDSLHWAEGDAPIPLGPVIPQFGSGTYKDSLASYNGSIASPGDPESYNPKRGPAIVVPIFGTGISIVYNSSGLTIPPGGLKLTQNDVCGIFAGQITNWSQTSADPGNVVLHPVHRSDGAAQTFQLSFVLANVCSTNNPNYLKYGVTNLWNQPDHASGVGTDSENYTSSGTILPDTNAPAVVWPYGFLAEKGTSGIVDCVNGKDDSGTGEPCGAGVVGYITPSFVPDITGGGEALVQNLAGNFEPANATTIAAALDGNDSPQRGPVGYPISEHLYFPFPLASGAAPITGYSYGYFYGCSRNAVRSQVKGTQAFFNYALTPAAKPIVNYWQFVPLSTRLRETTLKGIDELFAGKGSHSGTYSDPVTGQTKHFSCSPN
jgi:ABC-type phosphate transport system substrate-binding protein